MTNFESCLDLSLLDAYSDSTLWACKAQQHAYIMRIFKSCARKRWTFLLQYIYQLSEIYLTFLYFIFHQIRGHR